MTWTVPERSSDAHWPHRASNFEKICLSLLTNLNTHCSAPAAKNAPFLIFSAVYIQCTKRCNGVHVCALRYDRLIPQPLRNAKLYGSKKALA
jgi:hypothetical protein